MPSTLHLGRLQVLPAAMRLHCLRAPGAGLDSLPFRRSLAELLGEGGALGERSSVLVYCNFKDDADQLAEYLRAATRRQVASYHAGKTPQERARIQQLFAQGSLKAVVATVAYGMGLDNSHVTAVVHAGIPRSVEDLVQQVGRAGRGRPAGRKQEQPPPLSFVYVDDAEFLRLRSLARADGAEEEQVQRLLRIALGLTESPARLGPPQGRTRAAALRSSEAGAGVAARWCLLSADQLAPHLDMKRESIETLLAFLQSPTEGQPQPLLRQVGAIRTTVELLLYSTDGVALAERLDEGARGDPRHPQAAAAEVLRAVLHLCPNPAKGKHSVALWDLCLKTGRDPLSVVQCLGTLAKAGARCMQTGVEAAVLEILQQPAEPRALGRQLAAKLAAVEAANVARVDAVYRLLAGAAGLHEQGQQEAAVRAGVTSYFSGVVQEPGPPLPLRAESGQLESDIAAVLVDHDRSRHSALAGGSVGPALTRRAVARILQGLGSPGFPADRWSRAVYWRAYQDVDFDRLMRAADAKIREYVGAKLAAH